MTRAVKYTAFAMLYLAIDQTDPNQIVEKEASIHNGIGSDSRCDTPYQRRLHVLVFNDPSHASKSHQSKDGLGIKGGHEHGGR